MIVKTNHQLRVEQFMQVGGQAVPYVPGIPSENVRLLRARLILEEALETIEAMGIDISLRSAGIGAGGAWPVYFDVCILEINPHRQPDMVLIADGCGDLSVVTIGTLSAFGIADDPILKEIDRSNLDKFRNGVIKDEFGKIKKPDDWQPPNIQGVLDYLASPIPRSPQLPIE